MCQPHFPSIVWLQLHSYLTRGGNRADDIGSGKLGTRFALEFVYSRTLSEFSAARIPRLLGSPYPKVDGAIFEPWLMAGAVDFF